MIITRVMDEIGNRLKSIPRLNVLSYEADDITVPAAMVSLPTLGTFDETYGRGMDSMTLYVTILVSSADDRIRRDQIAPYADGSGPTSIKQVLQSGSYTAFHTLRVASFSFNVVKISEIRYLAAVFTNEITGQGS